MIQEQSSSLMTIAGHAEFDIKKLYMAHLLVKLI